MVTFRPHQVDREDRPDGSILLTSRYTLAKVACKTDEWLDHWATATPKAVFLGERSGAGWQEVTYGETHQMAEALARGLLGHGLKPGDRILVISGNSIAHAILSLAAQMVGLVTAPVAEQYALLPEGQGHLRHLAKLIKPRAVFAQDTVRFAMALAMPEFVTCLKLVHQGHEHPRLDQLMAGHASVDLHQARRMVGPDTIAKILTTSGSTGPPRGVPTSQGMLCANQAQIAAAYPFVMKRPPRLVDWLPWSHVFGGSHNFNLVLANGGSLHIDGGKPLPQKIATTLENLRYRTATISFNVPLGFTLLRDALRQDAKLRQAYFRDLDMIFYAGASLPDAVWKDLEAMARAERGTAPFFTTCWGLTETAPAALSQHEPSPETGSIGVPVAGSQVKLVPVDKTRFEVRLRGPHIFDGYLDRPEESENAFDEEGYFCTGDAVSLIDPQEADRGLKFEGRLAEEFKLQSGTWVRAGALRLKLLPALAPLVSDLVVCGEGRGEIGLILFLSPDGQGAVDLEVSLRKKLAPTTQAGSSTRIARVIIAGTPPTLEDGEITAKGNLNPRKILQNRADLVARLFDDTDADCILI